MSGHSPSATGSMQLNTNCHIVGKLNWLLQQAFLVMWVAQHTAWLKTISVKHWMKLLCIVIGHMPKWSKLGSVDMYAVSVVMTSYHWVEGCQDWSQLPYAPDKNKPSSWMTSPVFWFGEGCADESNYSSLRGNITRMDHLEFFSEKILCRQLQDFFF